MNEIATVTPAQKGQLQTQANSGLPSVYHCFRDPMEGINRLAEFYTQSGMVKNPGQAGIYAFACFCRGEDPFAIVAENMIVDGKLTRKYDMMLTDLRKAGGDYEWVKNGEDGAAATIRIHWKGRTNEYTYTMEMAKKRGLYDRNPNYRTQPGNMLRSKAVRESFRMYCPEVVGGCLTPEDANEIAADEQRREPAKATPRGRRTSRQNPRRSKSKA